jgi:cardiolipin synthase A/B
VESNFRSSTAKSSITKPDLSPDEIKLLVGGIKFFPDLIDEIHRAAKFIFIETYIFKNSGYVTRIIESLLTAAERGVKIYIMVDGMGSLHSAEEVKLVLKHHKIDFEIYKPIRKFISMKFSFLSRLHRKLIVVDGNVAYVGGINLHDDYDEDLDHPRFDFASKITGNTVKIIEEEMRELWLYQKDKIRIDTIAKHYFKRKFEEIRSIKMLFRDQIWNHRVIEDFYINELSMAKKSVLLANAYFLPGRRIRAALKAAAKRGVQIEVLLQGKREYWLVYLAEQRIARWLIKQNIKVYHYEKSYLHAKVGVFDETIATVGSSNLDPLSTAMARETNVAVSDPNFVKKLRAELQMAIQSSPEFTMHDYKKMPFFERILGIFFLLLSRRTNVLFRHYIGA